jgi:heme-degrading monooxygenase HmoA
VYAHVNIWKLSPGGATSDSTVASKVAEHLRQAPGFRSYTLIRTSEREVVAVTVFDSQHQLEAGLGLVSEIVSREVTPLVEGSPEVRGGAVLQHVTTS